jgi:hypothetical protein
MIGKRSPVIIVVGALILSLGARPIFAQQTAEQLSKRIRPQSDPAFLFLAKTSEKHDAKLKADMAKLVSDARAGKIVPRTESQLPSGQRQNLSKTAKIAIIAGVAVAVVGLVGWYAFTHAAQCKSRCVL